MELNRDFIRKVAISGSLLVSSFSLAACTGERPSFKKVPADASGRPVDACLGDTDFVVPPNIVSEDERGFHGSLDQSTPLDERVSRYEVIAEEFRLAKDSAEIEATAVKWFGEFGITPIFAQIPQASIDSGYTHSPEGISEDLLRISVRNSLRDVSRIPDGLLKALGKEGLEVYFSFGIKDSNGSPAPSFMYHASRDGKIPPMIVVGVDPEIDSGNSFRWGITERLAEMNCLADYDSFTSLNPAGFRYGQDTNHPLAYDSFMNHSATNDLETDVYETTRAVLSGSLVSECNPKVNEQGEPTSIIHSRLVGEAQSPICKKWELILGRLAASDRESAEELATIRQYS